MRIGLLTTSFPRFEGDIAGSFVLGFARALVQRGHSICVLAPEPPVEQAAPVWPAIETRYVRYVRPRSLATTFYGAGVLDNARDIRAWPGLATFAPALLAAGARELSDCDALVSHFGLPCGLVAGALRRGRPHLAVLHSADLHVLARMPGRALLASALALGAHHLTCVSEAHRAKLIAHLPSAVASRVSDRVHVQAMGVDTATLALAGAPHARQEARAALGVRGFTLLTLARLVPVKGLCEALDVLARRPDIEWVIAGDGPLRAELEARAARARRDHSARIRLVGEVRGPQKARWLAAADAFLLPSRVLTSGRTEGMPHALLEAMAAGLPVIASNVGGVRELVHDRENGLLFDSEWPDSLLAALDALTSSPQLATTLAQRASYTAQPYDWRSIAPRLEAWLE